MAISEAMVLLPMVFQYIQVIGYIVMVLFFGSIAMRGWKGWFPWYINLLARVGTGFVCLIAGVSLGPFMTGLRTGILAMFQLDLITVGVISSVIMSVALYLISFKSHRAALSVKKRIHKLERKLRGMGHPPKGMTKWKWAGLAIIVALVALSAVSFRGFPENAASEMFKSMGLPEEVADMSPECLSAMMAVTSVGEIRDPPLYENDALKSTIEAESGETVFEMYRIENAGATIIAVKTVSDKTCFATETDFCMCQ